MMCNMLRYVFLILTLCCSGFAYSDTYDFGSSYWVDDYSGDPTAYTGVYSYRIYQDGVQIIEVIDAATPTISDVVTAPAGVVLTVEMRNSNSLIPVGDPLREGLWTAQIPATEAGLPTPVTTWTIRVVHGT